MSIIGCALQHLFYKKARFDEKLKSGFWYELEIIALAFSKPTHILQVRGILLFILLTITFLFVNYH